jgi:glyoxylase-like metal-dependent hydrolase (beta-lactamase superfamily II)
LRRVTRAGIPARVTAGELHPVEPLVARLLAPNPSPFTGTGTQVHLVGGRELAVIDPGPDDVAHSAALLEAIGGRRVAAILVTHHHRDHSSATRALAAATGAPVLGASPAVRGASPAFDPDYAPDVVLADGEAVAGEGWTLRALATPGHSSGHLCFALEGTGALFTGDHVMGWSTTVVAPPDGDMGEYLASLDKLKARDDRIFYPAHGEPVTRPLRLLRCTVAHRRQREAQLLRLLGEGPDDVAGLAARMYPGLDERLAGGARASVLAHLLLLERGGEVARAGTSGWARA